MDDTGRGKSIEFPKEKEPKNKHNLRNRLHSFQTFLNYFYVDQNENPLHALIGPGPVYVNNVALTHLWYLFIVSFIPICSILATLGFVQPYLASDNTLCDWRLQKATCQSVIVMFITYRIGFAVSLFFLFIALILGRTTDTEYMQTSTLHTGFWIEKVIVVLLLSCAAFTFPPSTFDAVWIYAILVGDVVLTCMMLFLIQDLVKCLHAVISAYLTKKKWTELRTNGFLLLVMIVYILIMLSLSIYEVIKSTKKLVLCVQVTFYLFYMTSLLYYVTVYHWNELLSCMCTIAYTLNLVWNVVSYSGQHSETTPFKQQANWTGTSVTALFLMYLVIVYALVRKDQLSHFFYFRWVVCCGNVLKRTMCSTNFTQENKRSVGGCGKSENNGSHFINPNDTLLNLSTPESEENVSLCTDPQKTIPNNCSDTNHITVHKVGYNESFIHILLFLVSLKTTAVVTNYNQLVMEFDELTTQATTESLVILNVCCLMTPLLYTFYIVRLSYAHNTNPLSIGLLLQSVANLTINIIYKIFIGIPECFKKSPSLSRPVYSIFFLAVFSLACLVLSPSFRKYFEKTSLFCDHMAFGVCMSSDPTFISLYRIIVTVALFYLFICLTTINLYCCSHIRETIHNGCWLLKLILILMLFISITNLPDIFGRYWLYVGLLSTFFFTLLQMLCLLDAVGILTKSRREERFQAACSNSLFMGFTSLTVFLYVISIAAYVCFYVFYANNYGCNVTRLFVSMNLVLCIAASLISVHPIIQSGGLIRAAIVTSFCMYQIWSALNYNPMEKCNPLAHTIMLVQARPGKNFVSITDQFFLFVTLIYFTLRIQCMNRLLPSCNFLNEKQSATTQLTQDVIKAINKDENYDDKEDIERWLENCQNFSPVDAGGQLGENYGGNLLFGQRSDEQHIVSTSGVSATQSETENSNEYSYSCFHFVYCISCSYSFLLLAHWLEPVPGSGFEINLHWAIMSVKMVASSICVVVYIWLLISPLIVQKIRRR